MLKTISNIIYLSLIIFFIIFFSIIFIFFFFGRDLPNLDKLSYYQPRLVSKIYTAEGNFLEDYSNENRVFTKYEEIPTDLIECFLVSEDINFFNHIGIDYKGIARAFLKNVSNTFSDKRLEGASTITQQVAKNFLLSNEVSYSRKIKEIILSFRIESLLTKEQILELYLNEIYLGNGSYGITSASLDYFNKSLMNLELNEMAMLAALPKAPTTYNPYRNPIKAEKRRNWVLTRLLNENFIEKNEFDLMISKPIELTQKKKILNDKALFFKEAVRREIVSKFNENKLYDGGLSIMTTLDEDLQLQAENSFRKGLEEYDFRRGWRGPIAKFTKDKKWENQLKSFKKPAGLFEKILGVVIKVSDDYINIFTEKQGVIKLEKDQISIIKKENINWKKSFEIGYVIILKYNNKLKKYELSQIPEANGSMVVLDNQNGRVLAMVGGYDSSSSFNRAIQAKRQLGSSFKPFVYIAALENGYTPISKILDAPFVLKDFSSDGSWRPTNYGDKFYGISTLRMGIEKSRNLMTIRLADELGLEKISKISTDLGIYDNFPLLISSSLGSLESSLLKITAAYASIANGGIKVKPVMIDAIQDNKGKFIFKRETRKCLECKLDFNTDLDSLEVINKNLPKIKDNKKRIFSRDSAYQMTSFLMGVIERGTAKNINKFDFQIAGKTGTTNENQDAWFIGFNSEITVGVFVGHDKPKSLGKFETGSKVAAPIFSEFMNNVYNNKNPRPFLIPETIKFINVDLVSGLPSSKNFITESFKKSFNFEKNFQDIQNSEKEYDLKGFY
ncbi:MAG: penicillin-binding protein [Rickettsiales bacterium]|nr:penicillin-binding protein [Rickettsiales bacterium]